MAHDAMYRFGSGAIMVHNDMYRFGSGLILAHILFTDLVLIQFCLHSPNTFGCLLALNTLRPGQNGRYFTGDIFKDISLNENFEF